MTDFVVGFEGVLAGVERVVVIKRVARVRKYMIVKSKVVGKKERSVGNYMMRNHVAQNKGLMVNPIQK